jgi:hypothetical protein
MTSIIKIDHCFEPKTTQLQGEEGPITIIPFDTLKHILIITNHFFTHQSESFLLVCRDWQVLTFTTAKEFSKYALYQTISLISEKLNPNEHAKCITELAEIQDAYQSLTVTTCAQVQRLFLINKGFIIGALRNVPEEERDQFQIALGDELPDSMKDIFEISKLNLRMLITVDLDKFFTLLQSYQPLAIEDRGAVVHGLARENTLEILKVLLANGPISEDNRGLAVQLAATDNDIELVRLLLANGKIPDLWLDAAILNAAIYQNGPINPELVELLKSHGEETYNLAIEVNNNEEIAKLIQCAGSINLSLASYHASLKGL